MKISKNVFARTTAKLSLFKVQARVEVGVKGSDNRNQYQLNRIPIQLAHVPQREGVGKIVFKLFQVELWFLSRRKLR